MLIANDWTKNQVAIYYIIQDIILGTKLPVPDCFGTIVSPNLVLTTKTCLIEYATSGKVVHLLTQRTGQLTPEARSQLSSKLH